MAARKRAAAPQAETTARQSIEKILTPKELAALRKGFKQTQYQYGDGAMASVDSYYPSGAHVFDTTVKRFLWHTGKDGKLVPPTTTLSAANFERAVIAVLATLGTTPLFLSIHFYTGIASGIDPGEVAESLLVIQWYGPLESYTAGIPLLVATLQVMKQCADNNQTSFNDVVGALRAAEPTMTIM